MKKILILSENTIPEDYYGPSMVASTITKFLNSNHNRITIKKIPLISKINYNSYYKFLLANILNTLKELPNVIDLSKSHDVLIFQYLVGPSAYTYPLIGKLMKKNIIQYVFFYPRKIRVKFLNHFVKRIVVMNTSMAIHLEKCGTPSSQIKILWPPIDADVFIPLDKDSIKKKHSIPSNKFIVLYHGRPSLNRGIIFLLDSVKSMQEEFENILVILSLADTKDDLSLKSIKNYVVENNMENIVHFIIGKNNPCEMYNLADVVVFPFTANSSICPPLSVLEAMASEATIVATDISELGLQYVINNGKNGFLIRPIKSELIACLKIVNNSPPNILKDIGKNARITVLDNCSKRVINDYINKLIEDL